MTNAFDDMAATLGLAPAAATAAATDEPVALPTVEDETRRIAVLLPVSSRTRVPGLMYSVPSATALELVWTLAEALLGGRSGEYVMKEEIVPFEHKKLRI